MLRYIYVINKIIFFYKGTPVRIPKAAIADQFDFGEVQETNGVQVVLNLKVPNLQFWTRIFEYVAVKFPRMEFHPNAIVSREKGEVRYLKLRVRSPTSGYTCIAHVPYRQLSINSDDGKFWPFLPCYARRNFEENFILLLICVHKDCDTFKNPF